jgi:phosphoribosyl-AMP cyclohydrolase
MNQFFAMRGDKNMIEEGATFTPKFDEQGLITAIAQDANTNQILMVAYMNAETLAETLTLGQAVYWSRSRNQRWHKGATSGEYQDVLEILTDCDQDALILKVIQHKGGCCHTHRTSCFYRKVISSTQQLEFI